MFRADAETKVKLEKIQEIKRLNNETASIKNEIAKYDEQLEECKKYKDFLDKLTPAEWLRDMEQKVLVSRIKLTA
jgi:cell shape-determining protein MreC